MILTSALPSLAAVTIVNDTGVVIFVENLEGQVEFFEGCWPDGSIEVPIENIVSGFYIGHQYVPKDRRANISAESLASPLKDGDAIRVQFSVDHRQFVITKIGESDRVVCYFCT